MKVHYYDDSTGELKDYVYQKGTDFRCPQCDSIIYDVVPCRLTYIAFRCRKCNTVLFVDDLTIKEGVIQ